MELPRDTSSDLADNIDDSSEDLSRMPPSENRLLKSSGPRVAGSQEAHKQHLRHSVDHMPIRDSTIVRAATKATAQADEFIERPR